MRFTANSFRSRIALAVVLLALCALLGSQTAPREQVGPLAGGGFLLNSGWRLDPVGKQIPLDTLPMSSAVTPDGKYMLVLNCGYKPPSISVIDVASGSREEFNAPVPDAWLGHDHLSQGRPRLRQRRISVLPFSNSALKMAC